MPALFDGADAEPRIARRVERVPFRRHLGSRHIEPQKAERDVDQAAGVPGTRFHSASVSGRQSQGAGRVYGLMTSGVCQAWPRWFLTCHDET